MKPSTKSSVWSSMATDSLAPTAATRAAASRAIWSRAGRRCRRLWSRRSGAGVWRPGRGGGGGFGVVVVSVVGADYGGEGGGFGAVVSAQEFAGDG